MYNKHFAIEKSTSVTYETTLAERIQDCELVYVLS